MDKRHKDLSDLKTFIENTDKELTLFLQTLQWDQKHILEKAPLAVCSLDPKHRIPEGVRTQHELKCFMNRHGYTDVEDLLPEPVDINASTVVKLSKQDIMMIINTAVREDPTIKRGKGTQGPEPLTAGRLQQTYSADERRIIHDAVVITAPHCHDLADLALVSNNGDPSENKPKSRLEILAELRDMKRRRAKYRVPSKTSNYSHVLRDVIKTQMELYAEAKGIFIKTEYGPKTFISLNQADTTTITISKPTNIAIKQERITPEPDTCQETEKMRNLHHSHYDDTLDDRERQHHRKKHKHDKDRHHHRDRSYECVQEKKKYSSLWQRYRYSHKRHDRERRHEHRGIAVDRNDKNKNSYRSDDNYYRKYSDVPVPNKHKKEDDYFDDRKKRRFK